MVLEIITDDGLATVRHGFFTRKGGASSGIFAGLNCGQGSSDQSEIVALNRARVAEALDLSPKALASVHQVHSPDVVQITGPLAQKPRADAMVTATPGLGLAILTADCQPVLFADPSAGVIGAAHAGWKGAQTGVLEATVDAMEALGATASRITAVIGPCISQPAYEVGQEFFERFTDQDSAATRFFKSGVTADKYLFDLPAFGLSRLRARGIATARWTGHCTYSDEARFFSYRRTTHRGEKDYGRLISVIRL
ncbi:peptidoglycan editing factor PgeF [uncultured Lentibacter sp.]|uniref:peptidoglycan editing factor PgeF n=1 Tax=uncultured Lentibacter sp. TaxID=1659309 RepID=UPI002610C470|nr:peptidoglycan editing factor PgeF [uncultured Lentibacter sp.]